MVTPSSSLAPIVVVVDRGASDASVRFGAAEALRTGRPLELVHVAPQGDGWLGMVGQDALRRASTVADAEIVGRVDVHSSLVRGDVVAELVRVAADAALVVAEQPPAGDHRRPWTSSAQPRWRRSSMYRSWWCRRAGSSVVVAWSRSASTRQPPTRPRSSRR